MKTPSKLLESCSAQSDQYHGDQFSMRALGTGSFEMCDEVFIDYRKQKKR